MKIDKQASVVVTFPTTTAAMAFESAAQEAGLPGRVIPVPREISASCGLSFMVRKKDRESLDCFLKEHPDLTYQGIYDLML